jgi:tetratricopeptide (TPR) repeat protein
MVKTKRMIQSYPIEPAIKYQARGILLYGLLLAFWLTIFLGESLEAQEASDKLPPDSTGAQSAVGSSPRTAGLASRLNRRKVNSLWQGQGRIALTPETEQQIRDKRDFQKVIDRLNSMDIRDKKPAPVPTGVDSTQAPTGNAGPQTVVRTQPNGMDSATAQLKPAQEIGPALTDNKTGALSSGILEKLMKLSDRPDELMDPFGIAEILYSTGHLPAAARFYEKALERINREDPVSARNRAWIIFQRANCLRRQEPLQAMEIYQMLLSEYPDSPWKDAAQTWLELAQWYSKEKPAELIQECEQLKLSVNRELDELDS